MNKFSVIAILVVVGLCLLTLPAEGYVSGFRFTDMSDLGLHYPREKRQSQQDIDAQNMRERQDDGRIMSGSKNDPSKINFYKYETSNDEKHDPRANEGLTSPKRAPLTNEHQSNENDINAYNTARITVADVMFILEKN